MSFIYSKDKDVKIIDFANEKFDFNRIGGTKGISIVNNQLQELKDILPGEIDLFFLGLSKDVKELDDGQETKRLNGTVKWFNVSKGYGFIKREDKEKDVFVHSSAVENSGLKYLKKDEQLTFEVESSDKGPSAVNLQKTVAEVSHSHLKVVK